VTCIQYEIDFIYVYVLNPLIYCNKIQYTALLLYDLPSMRFIHNNSLQELLHKGIIYPLYLSLGSIERFLCNFNFVTCVIRVLCINLI
jgi:hypothetical protein